MADDGGGEKIRVSGKTPDAMLQQKSFTIQDLTFKSQMILKLVTPATCLESKHAGLVLKLGTPATLLENRHVGLNCELQQLCWKTDMLV